MKITPRRIQETFFPFFTVEGCMYTEKLDHFSLKFHESKKWYQNISYTCPIKFWHNNIMQNENWAESMLNEGTTFYFTLKPVSAG
jgi:hypothetical protein